MKKLYILAVSLVISLGVMAQASGNDTVQATFKKGPDDWLKFLTTNLKSELGGKYIKIPKGQKSATQTVVVSFIVDLKGYVTEVTVENPKEVHPKLANETMRVVSESPRWKPAFVNGKPVLYKHIQSITFSCTVE